MKRQPRILAGTALSLLMACQPLMAAPMPVGGMGEPARAPLGARASAPIVLAQAEELPVDQPQDQSSEEQLPKKKHRKADQAPAEQSAPEAMPRAQEAAPAEAAPEQPRKKKHREEPAAEQPAQQEFAPAEAMPERPRKKNHNEAPAAEQPAATQEFAPAPAEAAPEKPRKKNHKEAPAAEQPAAPQELTPAPAEAAPEKPRKKNHKEAPAAEQPAATQEFAPAPAEAAPEKPRKKNGKQAPAAEQPTAPQELTPAPVEKPVEIAPTPAEAAPEQPHKKNRKEAPAAEQPAPGETTAPTPTEKPAEVTPVPGETPAPTEAAPSGTTPAEQPAEAKPERPRKKGDQQAPAASEQPAAPGEAVTPAPAETEGQARPVPGKERPARGEATGEGKTLPAPDSQKAAPVEGQEQGAQDQGKRGQQGGNRRPQPAEAGPPPADDKAAQQEVQPEKIVPVTAEQGKRVKERPVDLSRQERPKGTEVLKEIGDRVIIQLNNQVMVESNDRPRMRHGARDVYYEDLPRGRTRETIERGDGTRVVTIRNAYGDVVRRSRIMPDGREYVLSYVDEGDYDRVRDWRDPGRDLPPLRLDIPEDDYVLTPERVRNPDMYYDFLEQPPVERVERLYSIDEVKRSARIRDKTRRIDLDTINFEFGSAAVAENEISHLEGVAKAMERILEQNPAETFLIEGHTDAVGSELANLALSDRRAESVAAALTNVFGIPPENLATQGYGKQFLKVKTQAPERQNRRVVIRRITPLVAPVASNR
ncbi:OmpA family protein [Mesorhizobium sp. KR1-2]|uniref:OmpA family protein n=1 Tax=Mesorhizobium sp. KR1-2 TaxID=3156609 RepID=UPI0032B4571D